MPDFFASCAFSADESGVAGADDWLEDATSLWGVDRETAFAARLCVAELATNLMQHGAAAPGATFMVSVTRSGDEAQVDYSDNGRAFDPTCASAQKEFPIETEKVGGLGLRLLRSYASRMSYERDGDRNRVRLCFDSSRRIV